jgi:hypothetical protein
MEGLLLLVGESGLCEQLPFGPVIAACAQEALPVDMHDGKTVGREIFLRDDLSRKLSTSYTTIHAHVSHNALGCIDIAMKIVGWRKRLIGKAVGWNTRAFIETLRGDGIVRASRMCRKSEA